MNYNDVLNWSNLTHFIKHFVNEVEIAGTVFSLCLHRACVQLLKKWGCKPYGIAWDAGAGF